MSGRGRCLAVWVLFMAVATMAPFDFRRIAVEPQQGRALLVEAVRQLAPVHLALNMLLFVPFGALLDAVIGRSRFARAWSSAIVVAGAACLVSIAIESAQLWLPGRESSPVDVMANTLGGASGVVFGRMWAASLVAGLGWLQTRTAPWMLVAALTGVLLLTLLVSGALQARARLSDWDTTYPLLIGNELTGDRPWRGRVSELEIFDAATSRAAVREFAEGKSVAIPAPPVAAYNLTGDPPYRDVMGHLPSLDWTEASGLAGDRDPHLAEGRWLRARKAVSALVGRLGETNAFTLRLRCATEDPNQNGPARIVSNSVSPFRRNFTVGQEGRDLVFRLRTPATGLNGARFETIAPGAFSTREPVHVLITYDGAAIMAAIAGAHRVVRNELSPGANVALADGSFDVNPDRLEYYKVAYLAALFLPPGALIGLLGRTAHQRIAFGVAYLVVVAVAVEGVLVLVSGRAFDAGNLGTTAGIGAAVLWIVAASVAVPSPSRTR